MKSIDLILNELKYKIDNNKIDFGVLATALISIDICSQIEYGDKARLSDRYPNWCEKYLKDGFGGIDELYLDPQIIYQIRCSILHSGTTSLDEKKLNRKINFNFIFNTNKNKKVTQLFLKSNVLNSSENSDNSYDLNVDMKYFVETIYSCVNKYYLDFKYKFDKISDFEYYQMDFVLLDDGESI